MQDPLDVYKLPINEVHVSIPESALFVLCRTLDEAFLAQVPYSPDQLAMANEAVLAMKAHIREAKEIVNRIVPDYMRDEIGWK